MSKKIIALLLVFAFALACLTGCGSKRNQADSVGSEVYVSETPLGFYDTLEAMKSVKDLSFQLSVGVPQEDGEEVQLFTASGVSYASTKQAQIEILDQEGKAVTELSVDGNVCYLQYRQLIDYVVRTYEQDENKDALAEDLNGLQDLQKEAPKYISIQLKEDPWTTWEGSSTEEMRDLLSQLYRSVKRDTEENSKKQDDTYRFSLGGMDLQTQITKVLDSLVSHKTAYTTVVEDYLTENFASFLKACAYTAEEVTDLYWDDFESRQAELEEQAAEGTWPDWQVTASTCGDAENGYTLDFTSTGERSRHYLLSVVPAEAAALTMPKDAEDYQESLADCAYVYYAFRNANRLLTARYDEVTSSEGEEELTEEPEFVDLDGDGLDDNLWSTSDSEEAYVMDLELTPISGYERISSALAATEDGVDQEVPVFTDYTTADMVTSEQSEGATDLYQDADGYSLEWYSLDATTRTVDQIVEENLEGYQTVYQEDWGYEIVQKQTAITTSTDGRSAVGAFVYHDSEVDSDVTMINAAVQVDNSDYALCVEICLYSDGVMNKEINAAKDLLNYLGLRMPIDVRQE